MNIFKRVYCRTFQGVFRLALPFLPYREPKILNDIVQLKEVFERLKINSLIIVTDSGIRNIGLINSLEDLLIKNKINYEIYDKTRPNPTVSNVEEARELYLNGKCQGIIAVGGGSAIDCAKALGARIAYPKKDLNKLKGLLHVLRKIPPLIAVPTTAGTGSEVTLTSVITDEKRHYKYTMNSFTLIPQYAILDPKMTFSLPNHLTATTGMDALTHAVEAYIGQSITKETRNKALKAISLIFNNIDKAYFNGNDYKARENMLKAAYLAGIAFSKSYVGYIHAIAHSLGGQYNISHGLANSILMPIVLESYGAKVYKKLHKLGIAASVSLKEDTHQIGALKFIEAIKNLNKMMNIPEKIKGINQEDIDIMAKYAAKEANPLYPVPVLKDAKELAKLYYKIGDWS